MSTIQLKLCAYAVMAVMLFGSGYKFRDSTAKSEAALVAAAHEKEVAEYETRAREASDKAAAELSAKQAEFAEIDKRNTEAMINAKTEIDSLHDAIANGSVRLSIPTRAPAPGTGVQANGATVCSSVGDGKTRTDIDPQTSQRIVRVTDEGDQAIRQLAACQEFVKAVQKRSK